MDRIGERFRNRDELGGYEFIIVEYNNNRDVWVEFQDEYKSRTHTTYANCRKGLVKNYYHPTVYGIGFMGNGKYKSRINGKNTNEYREWKSMLERCYNKECQNKRPTYKYVTVDEYFHNFQNYCKWREDNYYEIEGEKMNLDKDILCKGNKIYAPDKCIFVPERINELFIKCDAIRGAFPIGVTYNKRINKYTASCRIENKKKHLGYYDTPEEAFKAYKTFKEAYIKQIADEYKNKIPKKLYDAMYAWTVEEDD